ncbi:MAG: ATP-binding protein, partial [Sphingobacteriales bacterium]
SIISEQQQLENLYQPLMVKLSEQGGTLGKLSFKVQRQVNIEMWANEGEQLLDLRIAGPFRGLGAIQDIAEAELRQIWESGTAEEISQAVVAFVDRYRDSIVTHSPHPRTDQENYRQWTMRVAKWLFNTKHITCEYAIQYDHVDIQQLSPGTRGIVLLLIFLAVDIEDDRPLLIDQPEENLDPKSIFDELVPLFSAVKSRRQVIIVTHNANLVTNTDADQVIVAQGGKHRPNQLPIISYISGGLENPDIRKAVCEILEGGEAAFKERARRLRVHI